MLLIADKKLSEHFWLHEMASKGLDGPYVEQGIEVELFCVANERFRVWYNRIMNPSSWHRTLVHNAEEGGSSISQHLLATATDNKFPINEGDEVNTPFSERQDEFLVNITTAWAWIIMDLSEEYKDVIKKFKINMNTGIFWYWWGFHLGFGQYNYNRWKDYRNSSRNQIL